MTEERTLKDILVYVYSNQSEAYESAKDTSKSDMDREWYHGYADALHDLETFIRRTGPFRQEVKRNESV